MLPRSIPVLSLATLAVAAKVGYFDSKVCVDPSGMEECYANTESAWSDCINENCKGQNIDCHNVCSCIRTEGNIDCAATHCWNQVYSCEYQETAGEIGTYCIKPDFSDVPFFPAPDNAPGACSCNLGKLLAYLRKSIEEIDTCGRNGMEIINTLTSNDELQVFTRACTCCAQSAQLSSFYEICPDTDPSILGFDEFYKATAGNNKDWPNCANFMSEYPCGKDGLDFTPPSESSANFYEPDEFPASGTQTTSNMAGTITSPISGATFTWTVGQFAHAITVASPDARPTGQSDDDDDSKDGNDKDKDTSGNDNSSEANDGDDGGNGQGQGGNNNDEGAASTLAPGLLVVLSALISAVML